MCLIWLKTRCFLFLIAKPKSTQIFNIGLCALPDSMYNDFRGGVLFKLLLCFKNRKDKNK